MTRNNLISLGQRVSSMFRRTPRFSFILGAIDTDAATTSQNQVSDHSQQDEETSEGEEKMDQEEKDYWQDVNMEIEQFVSNARDQQPAEEVPQEVGGRSRSRGGNRGATKKRGSRSGPRSGTRSKKGSARGV